MGGGNKKAPFRKGAFLFVYIFFAPSDNHIRKHGFCGVRKEIRENAGQKYAPKAPCLSLSDINKIKPGAAEGVTCEKSERHADERPEPAFRLYFYDSTHYERKRYKSDDISACCAGQCGNAAAKAGKTGTPIAPSAT